MVHHNLAPTKRLSPLYSGQHDIPARLYLPTTTTTTTTPHSPPHPRSAATGLLIIVDVTEQAEAVYASTRADRAVERASRGHGEPAADDEHAGAGYAVFGRICGGAVCRGREGVGGREYEGQGGEAGGAWVRGGLYGLRA